MWAPDLNGCWKHIGIIHKIDITLAFSQEGGGGMKKESVDITAWRNRLMTGPKVLCSFVEYKVLSILFNTNQLKLEERIWKSLWTRIKYDILMIVGKFEFCSKTCVNNLWRDLLHFTLKWWMRTIIPQISLIKIYGAIVLFNWNVCVYHLN